MGGGPCVASTPRQAVLTSALLFRLGQYIEQGRSNMRQTKVELLGKLLSSPLIRADAAASD